MAGKKAAIEQKDRTMTKFEIIKSGYQEQFSTEAYANSTEHKNLLALFDAAGNLSAAAQMEFVRAFSFEFALDGEIYVGSLRRALAVYPHLYAEAPGWGIKLVMREKT